MGNFIFSDFETMDLDDSLKQIIMCFLGIFCCGLILFAAIAGFGSMKTLEITEVGLDFDQTRVKINDKKLYTGGRHFLGLTHKFLKFQTNLQQMKFNGEQYRPIDSRSKDGLESTINISFQYKLQLDV